MRWARALLLAGLLGPAGALAGGPAPLEVQATLFPTSSALPHRAPRLSPDGSELAWVCVLAEEARTLGWMAEFAEPDDSHELGPRAMGEHLFYQPHLRPPTILWFAWAPPGSPHRYAYSVDRGEGLQVYIDGWSGLVGDRFASHIAWDPTGSGFAFSKTSTTDDIFLWQSGAELQISFDDAHDEVHPSWSGDGRWITYVRRDESGGGVMRFDVESWASVQLTGRGPTTPSFPAFSPDQSTVAYLRAEPGAKEEAELWTVDNAPGGASRRLHRSVVPQAIGPVQWTPDGAWLLVVAKKDDGSNPLAFVSADGQRIREVVTGTFANRDPHLVAVDGGLWRIVWASPGSNPTRPERLWTTDFDPKRLTTSELRRD